MRISYRWLNRHVDLSDLAPAQVADLLTHHVAEVDGVEAFAPALDAVRVGLVLSREPHPNADRLGYCQVDLGEGDPLGIVCGAPNVAAGQKVAVATVGTQLPGGILIGRAKIRGVASEGMICSERELGLGDEHQGIWVLPEAADPGRPVAEIFGGSDHVILVDNKAVTHRPDLWGHRGLARELAALLDRPLAPLELGLPPCGGGPGFPVRIESPHCRRFVALPIEGLRTGPSPDWLRLLLLAAGQRPIDCLVDASNFVMLDLGQPSHLFDRRAVSGGIVVRQARADERLVTLDGVERRLQESDLLICSTDAPVALAGIMGGEASKVAADSDSLLLEVAAFDAATIRRTSARLGLRSEASSRFEKSLDPSLPLQAAAHLVRLLAAQQPDLRLPAAPTDLGDWRPAPTQVRLRPDRVRGLLGVALDDDRIADILGRLRFAVDRSDLANWRITVPSDRATKDVGLEEDLIEEVGRFHGYDAIPEQPIQAALAPALPDRRQVLVATAADFLAGAPAFHEVLSYSFLDEGLARRLGLDSLPHSQVVNAVAAGLARLRRDVAPSLLGHLERNLRLEPDLRLFEIGKGSRPESVDGQGKPAEVEQVALVWAKAGPVPSGPWDGRQAALKGVLTALLRRLGVGEPAWRAAAEDERAPWAHPVRAATALVGARPVAWLMDLDPAAALRMGLEADVAVAWVDLDALATLPLAPAGYRPIPRFPGVKLDVAIAAEGDVSQAAIAEAISKAGGASLASCELFDVYAAQALGGRRSLAYHLLLQAAEGTLTDEDAARFLGRLERELAALGAELRKG